MRWYKERQALKQAQASRSTSAAKAQSILQSLNGTGPTPTHAQVDQEAELQAFDRKVHAAQVAMQTAMTAELKGLGVPFFGTNPGLVIPDESNRSQEQPPEDHPRWSALVTEADLLELRRRMVGHLEDLYRD